MNSIDLKTFLTSNLDIGETEISSIVENCPTKKVKKDQFLLRENEFCKHAFFVEQGLLRQFSVDKKGKEHILYFAPESWLVSDRESVFFNQPSVYFIQALEDGQVAVIDESFVQMLSKKFPQFTEFNTRLLHNHIRRLQNRINMLLSASAEDRYLEFVAMYPDIVLRVPQVMVASYLGVTPESLSRVRRELAQKKHQAISSYHTSMHRLPTLRNFVVETLTSLKARIVELVVSLNETQIVGYGFSVHSFILARFRSEKV